MYKIEDFDKDEDPLMSGYRVEGYDDECFFIINNYCCLNKLNINYLFKYIFLFLFFMK